MVSGSPVWLPFALVAGCWLTAIIGFFGYAYLFSTPGVAAAYQRAGRWIEVSAAVVYVGLGGLLLFS